MSTDEPGREPRILLVEDNPVDVLMIRRALQNSGFMTKLMVVDDGEPAMAFLGRQEKTTLPDLVILDLNLRRIDGPEVLAFIRTNSGLKNLRVIVLSSSSEDVMKTSASGADLFLQKATDVESLRKLGESIRIFYLNGNGKGTAAR